MKINQYNIAGKPYFDWNYQVKIKDKILTIFGSNANGILGKQDSLKNNILNFRPAVFFVQETKVSRKGQIKIENYEIFERQTVLLGGQF